MMHDTWHGKGTTQREREMARETAKEWGNDCNISVHDPISEGYDDTRPFWEHLDMSNVGYCNVVYKFPQRPKLFICSNASGLFRAEEVYDFCQDDMQSDDVMVLDCFTKLFVSVALSLPTYDITIWEGPSATKFEKKDTLQFTVEYCKLHPDRRSELDPNWWQNNVFIVKAKQEPLVFSSCFFGWDTNGWTATPFDQLKSAQLALQEYSRTYTLEELVKRPDTVDPARLETYLSEEEFKRVFGCTPQEFEKVSQWKKEEQKKALGLF